MAQVDQLVTDYVAQHFPKDFDMVLLAGSSIHADKAFISCVLLGAKLMLILTNESSSKDLPLLHSKLHYRILELVCSHICDGHDLLNVSLQCIVNQRTSSSTLSRSPSLETKSRLISSSNVRHRRFHQRAQILSAAHFQKRRGCWNGQIKILQNFTFHNMQFMTASQLRVLTTRMLDAARH